MPMAARAAMEEMAAVLMWAAGAAGRRRCRLCDRDNTQSNFFSYFRKSYSRHWRRWRKRYRNRYQRNRGNCRQSIIWSIYLNAILMSEVIQYPIYCESCKIQLEAWWSPPEGVEPTEAQIIRGTQTGYLCQTCATPPSINPRRSRDA